MASAFNLTAQLNLRGPSNVGKIVSDIRKQLGTIQGNVDLKINATAVRNVTQLNSSLQGLNKNLSEVGVNASRAASAISAFVNSANSVNRATSTTATNTAKVTASIDRLGTTSKSTSKAIVVARTEIEEFGRQSALAVRRFAAFSAATGAIFGIGNAFRKALGAFIEFDKEFVKIQQVTEKTAAQLGSLSQEITTLSVGLGVASADLINVAQTLAQAGLSARDTEKALRALALSDLAPSFDNINDTVEGSIALMRQFNISAGDLEGALGSVNAVAARFAVEASDLIAAIQRTGGVFATASKGVSEGKDALNEFLAVFTSVRQTTRESAETIATGLRTIFTRIQRESTIEALREYGVVLTDAEGKFVGAYKAVQLLSEGLSKLDPRDVKFSRIVEELGGFRQIGKVIPLIQQFAVAQEALKVAQAGQGSLASDAIKAQLSLANQIAKVREEFLAFVRDIGTSDTFQTLAKGALSLTSGLIKIASALRGVLPILAILGISKGASALTQFGAGFIGGIKKTTAGGGGGEGPAVAPKPGSTGGPSGALEGPDYSQALDRLGEVLQNNINAIDLLSNNINNLINSLGSINNFSTELTNNTASLVANTASIDALTAAVTSLNLGGGGATLNSGGKVMRFARGGVVPGSGDRDTVPAMLMPGEFVIRKKAVETIGTSNLQRINKYANGGKVQRYLKGGVAKSSVGELAKQSSTVQRYLGNGIDTTDDATGHIIPVPVKLEDADFRAMKDIMVETETQRLGYLQKYGKNPEANQQVRERARGERDPRSVAGFLGRKKPDSQWGPGNAFQQLLIRKGVKGFSPPANFGTPEEQFKDIMDEHYAVLDFESGDAKFTKDPNQYDSPKGQREILNKRFKAEIEARRLSPKPSPDYDNFQLPSTSIYYPEIGAKEQFLRDYPYTILDQARAVFPAGAYNQGGIVQKFADGSIVKELAAQQGKSVQEMVAAQVVALGRVAGIKELLGISKADRKLDGLLRLDAIKTYTPDSPKLAEAVKFIDRALEAKGGVDAAEEVRLSALSKVAVAGLVDTNGNLDYNKDFEWDVGTPDAPNMIYAYVRGFQSKYRDAVNQMQRETSAAASRFAENVQYADIFGAGERLAFDFDETLVKGADILGENGLPDIPSYSNRRLVADKLKDGNLTLLGNKLKTLVEANPDFIKQTRVLTARPQSTADLLASRLQELGLPYQTSDITGVGEMGANVAKSKASNLSLVEKLIDDNLANVTAATKAGKKAFLYTEPNLRPELDELIGQGNIEGAVVEKALALLGANLPSIEQLESNRAIDFPGGLGRTAQFFGLPPDIPTEIKRTLDGRSFERARDEFARYFEESATGFKLGGKVYDLQNRSRYAAGGAVKLYHGTMTGENDVTLKSIKEKGILSSLAGGYGQGSGFYVWSSRDSALKHTQAIESGSIPTNAAKGGYRMIVELTEMLDPKNWDLDYEIQAGDVANFVFENFEKAQALLEKAKGIDLGGGLSDFTLRSKNAEFTNPYAGKKVRQIGLGFKEDGREKRTSVDTLGMDYTLRTGQVIGGLVAALKAVDPTVMDAFEEQFFSNLKPGQALKYVGSAALKPSNIEVFSTQPTAPGWSIGDPESANKGGVDKKDKQFGKIGLKSDAQTISATYFKNDARSGNVTAYKMRDYLYYVGLSQATKGYGPRLYDAVMEEATAKGAMLTSDRSSVSGAAKNVWEYYFKNRSDVKKTPLKPDDWTKNSSMIDPKLYGKEETWPPATDPAWILQSGYSKTPDLINDPKSVMRTDQAQNTGAMALAYFQRKANGGSIRKFAKGGSPEDTVPALLTPGEFVINKKSAQKIGYSKLEKLNKADKLEGYNKGGIVGGIQRFFRGGQAEKDVVRAQGRKLTDIAEVEPIFKDILSQLNPTIKDAIMTGFQGVETIQRGKTTRLGGIDPGENTRGLAILGNRDQKGMAFRIGGRKGATTETVAHETGHLADASLAEMAGATKGFASEMEGTFQFAVVEKVKRQMEEAFTKAGYSAERIANYLGTNQELFAEFFAKASPEVRSILTSTTDAAQGMKALADNLGEAGFTYAGLEASDIDPTRPKPPEPPKPPSLVSRALSGIGGALGAAGSKVASFFRPPTGGAPPTPPTPPGPPAPLPQKLESLTDFREVIASNAEGFNAVISKFAEITGEIRTTKTKVEELKTKRQELVDRGAAPDDPALQQINASIKEQLTKQRELVTTRTATASRAGVGAGMETDVGFSIIEYVKNFEILNAKLNEATEETKKAVAAEVNAIEQEKQAKAKAVLERMKQVTTGSREERFAEARTAVESGDFGTGTGAADAKAALEAATQAKNIAAAARAAAQSRLDDLEITRDFDYGNAKSSQELINIGAAGLGPAPTIDNSAALEKARADKLAAEAAEVFATRAKQAGTSVTQFTSNLKKDVVDRALKLQTARVDRGEDFRATSFARSADLRSGDESIAKDAERSIRRSLERSLEGFMPEEEIQQISDDYINKLKNMTSVDTTTDIINNFDELNKALTDSTDDSRVFDEAVREMAASMGIAETEVRKLIELGPAALQAEKDFKQSAEAMAKIEKIATTVGVALAGLGTSLSDAIKYTSGKDSRGGTLAAAGVEGFGTTTGAVVTGLGQIGGSLINAKEALDKFGPMFGEAGAKMAGQLSGGISKILPMLANPYVLAGAAVAAVAVGALAAAKAMHNAAKEFDKSQAAKRVENAMEKVSQAFEDFEKDIRNIKLLDTIEQELVIAGANVAEGIRIDAEVPTAYWTNLFDALAVGGSEAAQRSMILEQKGFGAYMASSQFGQNPLGFIAQGTSLGLLDPLLRLISGGNLGLGVGEDSASARAAADNRENYMIQMAPAMAQQQAAAFRPVADATLRLFENKLKTGTSMQDVLGELKDASGKGPSQLAESIARANPVIQEQILNIQASNNLSDEAKKSMIDEIIAREANYRSLLTLEAAQKQIDFEKMQDAMSRFVTSLQRMYDNMDRAIAKTSFELDGMSRSLELSNAALSGQAKAGEVSLRSINVLQNPQAYSTQARQGAVDQAAGFFGSEAATMRSMLQIGPMLEQTVMSTMNRTLKEDAGASDEKIAGNIRVSLDKALDSLGLPPDLSTKMSKQVQIAFAELREKGDEDIGFDELAEKVPALSNSIQSAKAAQEVAIRALEFYQKNVNEYAKAMNEAVDMQISANNYMRQANDIEIKGRIQLNQALGRSLSLQEQQNNQRASTRALTGGPTAPLDIRNNLINLNQTRAAEQAQADMAAQRGPAGRDQFIAMQQNLKNTNVTLRENYTALKNLAESGDMASAALSKINEIQQKTQAGVGIIEKLVTSSPEEINKFNKSLANLDRNMRGMQNASTAEERSASLQAFNMIAPFLGDSAQQNTIKANVLESMLLESGVGVNGMMAQVLDSLRNPEQNPEMAAAIKFYDKSIEDQAEANRALGSIEQLMSNNTADIAASKFADSIAATKLSFESQQLVDIHNEVIGLRKDVQDNKDAGAAPGLALGGLIYASAGKQIQFQPKGTDTVPAMLTPGEFVVNRAATAKNLPLLQNINNGYKNGGKVSYYQTGGLVVGNNWSGRDISQDEKDRTKVEYETKQSYPILHKDIDKEYIKPDGTNRSGQNFFDESKEALRVKDSWYATTTSRGAIGPYAEWGSGPLPLNNIPITPVRGFGYEGMKLDKNGDYPSLINHALDKSLAIDAGWRIIPIDKYLPVLGTTDPTEGNIKKLPIKSKDIKTVESNYRKTIAKLESLKTEEFTKINKPKTPRLDPISTAVGGGGFQITGLAQISDEPSDVTIFTNSADYTLLEKPIGDPGGIIGIRQKIGIGSLVSKSSAQGVAGWENFYSTTSFNEKPISGGLNYETWGREIIRKTPLDSKPDMDKNISKQIAIYEMYKDALLMLSKDDADKISKKDMSIKSYMADLEALYNNNKFEASFEKDYPFNKEIDRYPITLYNIEKNRWAELIKNNPDIFNKEGINPDKSYSSADFIPISINGKDTREFPWAANNMQADLRDIRDLEAQKFKARQVDIIKKKSGVFNGTGNYKGLFKIPYDLVSGRTYNEDSMAFENDNKSYLIVQTPQNRDKAALSMNPFIDSANTFDRLQFKDEAELAAMVQSVTPLIDLETGKMIGGGVEPYTYKGTALSKFEPIPENIKKLIEDATIHPLIKTNKTTESDISFIASEFKAARENKLKDIKKTMAEALQKSDRAVALGDDEQFTSAKRVTLARLARSFASRTKDDPNFGIDFKRSGNLPETLGQVATPGLEASEDAQIISRSEGRSPEWAKRIAWSRVFGSLYKGNSGEYLKRMGFSLKDSSFGDPNPADWDPNNVETSLKYWKKYNGENVDNTDKFDDLFRMLVTRELNFLRGGSVSREYRMDDTKQALFNKELKDVQFGTVEIDDDTKKQTEKNNNKIKSYVDLINIALKPPFGPNAAVFPNWQQRDKYLQIGQDYFSKAKDGRGKRVFTDDYVRALAMPGVAVADFPQIPFDTIQKLLAGETIAGIDPSAELPKLLQLQAWSASFGGAQNLRDYYKLMDHLISGSDDANVSSVKWLSVQDNLGESLRSLVEGMTVTPEIQKIIDSFAGVGGNPIKLPDNFFNPNDTIKNAYKLLTSNAYPIPEGQEAQALVSSKLGLRVAKLKENPDALKPKEEQKPRYAATGGLIYASNGQLINFTPRGTDTVPAMLTPGEFVINRQATQQNLPLLQSINNGAKGYSEGGVVYLAGGGIVDDIAKFVLNSLNINRYSAGAAKELKKDEPGLKLFSNVSSDLKSFLEALQAGGATLAQLYNKVGTFTPSPLTDVLKSQLGNLAAGAGITGDVASIAANIGLLFDPKNQDITKTGFAVMDIMQKLVSLYGGSAKLINMFTGIESYKGLATKLSGTSNALTGLIMLAKGGVEGFNDKEAQAMGISAPTRVLLGAFSGGTATSGNSALFKALGDNNVVKQAAIQRMGSEENADELFAMMGAGVNTATAGALIGSYFGPGPGTLIGAGIGLGIGMATEVIKVQNDTWNLDKKIPEQDAKSRRMELAMQFPPTIWSQLDDKNYTSASEFLNDSDYAAKSLQEYNKKYFEYKEQDDKFYNAWKTGAITRDQFDKIRVGTPDRNEKDRLFNEMVKKREEVVMARYQNSRFAYSKGGPVYANSGMLIPYQPKGTDTVPAMLTPGEFVINRDSSAKYRPVLEAINNGNYNRGGIVNYLSNGGFIFPNYYQTAGNVTGNNRGFDFAGFMQSLTGTLMASIPEAIRKGFENKQTTQQNNPNGVSSIDTSVLDRLNEFTNRLKSVTDTLAALDAIPSQITVTGRHDVNIVINGDSALNQLKPDLQRLVMSQIKEKFDQLVNANQTPGAPLINPFNDGTLA